MAHLTEPAILVDWRFLAPTRTISNSTPVLDSSGLPANGRSIIAIRQDSGQIVGRTQTDTAGDYTIEITYAGPVYVIADGEPSKNALIQSGVVAT